ncbi:MAG: phage tail fiber protein [Aquabacterium sp.]
MAYSSATYPATGVADSFPIPFPYLLDIDIQVYVGGVLKTITVDYTIVSRSLVKFNVKPVGMVVLKRNTKKDAPLVDFQDATILTEADLDTATRQSLYISQEAYDTATQVLSVPLGEAGVTIPDKETRKGNLLGFDLTTGDPVAMAPLSLNLVAVSSFMLPALAYTTQAALRDFMDAPGRTTTAETITGAWTFSMAAPQAPDPTTASQLSTKNYVDTYVSGRVNSLSTAISAPGLFVDAAWTVPPAGYRVLRCNGQAPSVTAYPGLLSIYCGDTNNATAGWGYRCTDPANPSTTRSTTGGYIVLPKSNGRFRRDLTDGATLNVGRSLWAYEADDNKPHTHTMTAGAAGQGHGGETPIVVTYDAGSITGPSGNTESRPYNYACTTWITY